MKIIKTFMKLIGVIVGGYAIINTLVLARMGASRILRQIRIQYPDGPNDGVVDFIRNVDFAAIEEMDEEFEEWKEYRKK